MTAERGQQRKMKTGKILTKFAKMTGIGLLAFSLLLVIGPKVQAEKFNMSYLYFGGKSFVDQVNQTNGALHTVAPSYFDLLEDGSLDTSNLNPTFIQEMHNRNIKVVPFLSNHWNREKGRLALGKREALAQQIVDVIQEYNLDGVNVDFENLVETDRDDYTDFMRILHEKMPDGKELSIAVAANPFDSNKGWQGSYDYEALAQYSDYLMLMTYDESYFGGQPGPVASIKFVEKSIQYALEKAPGEKIVLGIPFYGRYWNSNEKVGGRGIPNDQVEKLTAQYNGKIHFDEKSKSPYATFTIKPSDAAAKVHGRTLLPGNYTVWFEDEQSIKYKLRLVQKYNLLGSGSWSLTEAQSSTWDYYSAWLNGKHYFMDAENHWAEKDILNVYKKGWMVGVSEADFDPEKPLTRAQGTVTLVRALGLTAATQNHTSAQPAFSDVSGDYWAANEILIAHQHGLVKGLETGKFAPDQPLTREQMAVILSRAFKYNKDGQAATPTVLPFTDVKPSHWAYADIAVLTQNQIFNGSTDGKFHPQDEVTRAQMAALMNRIAKDIETR
jgi:spore germination protein YaaH